MHRSIKRSFATFIGLAVVLVFATLALLAHVRSDHDDDHADVITIAMPKVDLNETEEVQVKRAFESIYSTKIWTEAGGGSGVGSHPLNGIGAAYILRIVMLKYRYRRLLDTPCGAVSQSWTADAINQLKQDIPTFEYAGVDIVESVIAANNAELALNSTYIRFDLMDISSLGARLPHGYDLILSRDALQHLSYKAIARTLRNYCLTSAKSLLVGSYLRATNNENKDIAVGDSFVINLLLQPFNFPKPKEIFPEPLISTEFATSQKHLLHYELQEFCIAPAVRSFINLYGSYELPKPPKPPKKRTKRKGRKFFLW
jgi:hypothetical protein